LSRINATVSQVLDFSKARPVALRRCTVAEVVEAARRLTATYVRKSDVVLEVDLAEDLPPLTADPDQLEQVFVNLILNACRAMPDGGRLTVSARAVDDAVRIEVADTGTGIAPERLGQIFDPFYSAFGSGTGLGLSLCRRIVQAHGGGIDVASEPGEGTTFRIDLPLEPPHAPLAGH
ncbi:MAG: sensor histidine kinase, partial [bacterium]